MTPEHPTEPVPPAWGWRHPNAGRAAHVEPGIEYQGTTVQLAGLYPFMAGSGAPTIGVPVGRHLLWGEAVCLDPLAWLRAGLITNPGMFLLGQPGAGKSALAKRLLVGMSGYGTTTLVLGDTKPDYTRLVAHLGGQVIRVGRGLDRINPLDAGPLGTALARMSGPDADQLRLEIRGRRLSLLLALCTLVRGRPVTVATLMRTRRPDRTSFTGARQSGAPQRRRSPTWSNETSAGMDRTSCGVSDITEHPTREGKFYCCVMLDAYSRRVVGWAIDSHQL